MTQKQKAQDFLALHVKSSPVVLYNVWDAGTAVAVADAGARAIATGSWSVAAAHGYADGQNMPLELALSVAELIVASTDLPVTVDFEGGYATDAVGITQNVGRLLQTGAIGMNFEDQIVGGDGLYDIASQSTRITAARQAADAAGIPAVINARTDLFLKEGDANRHAGLVDDAIARAAAYADAGADCFFIPGLTDHALIADICAAVALPVNVMVLDIAGDLSPLAATGVARISFGPAPYLNAMSAITEAAKNTYRRTDQFRA